MPGNEVTKLVNKYREAGKYEIEFKSTVGKWNLLPKIAGGFISSN